MHRTPLRLPSKIVAERSLSGKPKRCLHWLATLHIAFACSGMSPGWATDANTSISPKTKATTETPEAKDSIETAISSTSEVKAEDDRNSVARIAARRKGEITFDDLKFEIERGGKFQRSMLSKEIEAFDKQTLRIRGYILPASVVKQQGIEEFVLVRDNQECCFGPQAMLYDCIMVQMEPGKVTEFSTRPIAVKGKFEVKEFTYPDSDEHYAIFRIVATEAK